MANKNPASSLSHNFVFRYNVKDEKEAEEHNKILELFKEPDFRYFKTGPIHRSLITFLNRRMYLKNRF